MKYLSNIIIILWTVWVLIKHGNDPASDDLFRFLMAGLSAIYLSFLFIKYLKHIAEYIGDTHYNKINK